MEEYENLEYPTCHYNQRTLDGIRSYLARGRELVPLDHMTDDQRLKAMDDVLGEIRSLFRVLDRLDAHVC